MCSVSKRKPRNWTPQMITRALHDKGVTHASLAVELGRGRSTVSLVVGARAKSAAVADAVAAVLGTTKEAIWPRIYPAKPASGDAAGVEHRHGQRRDRRVERRHAVAVPPGPPLLAADAPVDPIPHAS
jgi:lambda repressor-like predicted transcriptional regulator